MERCVAGEVVMCGRGAANAKGAKAWWIVGSGHCGHCCASAAAGRQAGRQAGKQKQSARCRARASHSPPGPVGRDDTSLRWASQKLNCAERAERISLSSGRFSGRAPLAGSQKLLFCWPRSGTVAVCRGSGVGGGAAASKQHAAGQRVLGGCETC